MIESLAPIIGAGAIVISTVITQLYIHRNTIIEQDGKYIQNELNVSKLLLQLLQKYEVQGERFKNSEYTHQMTQRDFLYLQDYFDRYGNLLSKSIHKQYHEMIKRDTFYGIFGPHPYKIELSKLSNGGVKGSIGSDSLMNDKLCDFQNEVELKVNALESKHSRIINAKPRMWWLRPSWRHWYNN